MNDLIYRQALLDDIQAAKEYGGMGAVVADTLKRYVKRQPSIEAAPVVHGRWVWDTTGLYPKPLCSRCEVEPWRRSNHQSDLPSYCPNCGARMDMEGNDNA